MSEPLQSGTGCHFCVTVHLRFRERQQVQFIHRDVERARNPLTILPFSFGWGVRDHFLKRAHHRTIEREDGERFSFLWRQACGDRFPIHGLPSVFWCVNRPQAMFENELSDLLALRDPLFDG